MATVRRVPEADLERYRRLTDYAFTPEDGPPGADPEIPDRIADRYGLYDEQGRMIATGALYEFEARLRGDWAEVGGVAAVSSPPEYRREGNIRLLCRELLEHCRDRDLSLAALWPFSHDFYEQFGWAISNKYTDYEMPPEQLAAAGTTSGGRFEPVGPDDWERLESAQRAHGEGTTLSRKRSEDWWRKRTFDHDDETPWAYAWVRDGETRGYVIYTFESGDDGRRLRVLDVSAADADARRHLLGFLGTHDSQAETVRLTLAEESALLDAVDDPRAVECSINAGPMVRISDVPSALAACPYPDDAETTVVFEVSDPLSVVDGCYELTVGGGTGDCERTDAEPGVSLGVGTLSQMLVGYRDASALEAADLGCDEATKEQLDRLLSSTQVCLREFF
jgi:predicted acetyltransferase